jgi:hypothetical protein
MTLVSLGSIVFLVTTGIGIGQEMHAHPSTSRGQPHGLLGLNEAVGTLTAVLGIKLPTFAIATPITADTTAGVITAAPIVLGDALLNRLRVKLPVQTDDVAHFSMGCNATPANISDMRLPIATCLQSLSSWIGTPKRTYRMRNILKLNRTGLLVGKRNLGAQVGHPSRLCGHIVRRITSLRRTWTMPWTGTDGRSIQKIPTSND